MSKKAFENTSIIMEKVVFSDESTGAWGRGFRADQYTRDFLGYTREIPKKRNIV